MEYFKKAQQEQNKIERLIVGLFTLYGLSLCASFIRREEPVWLTGTVIILLVASWVIHISKFRNPRVRSTWISVIMQFAIILYATHVENLIDVAPTFMAVIVLMALFSHAGMLFLTLLSVVFTVFYHGVIVGTFTNMPESEIMRLLPQLGNILCMELVLYIWIKNRNARQEQIYQVIDALIDAEKSKDDFLANVSHEIRTPVNTICGMSEMTLREHDPEKMRDEIFDIRDAGQNLMSLVSDILDFSQLQQGKMNIEEEAYNITSTINDVINMAMARKKNSQVELIVDCDANIPSVLLGDEKKIRRVIMNLVNNAIKFTNDGGIIIGIHARKEDYGINLCVSIKDTGIGISEEALEKIFESFSQVDSKRNRQEGGVGLGLPISRELLAKMGGTITVRSKLGKGSVFSFVVPQKVVDEKPIVQVENREKVNVAAYFDMEQFDMMTIRDEYSTLIINMIRQLRVKCHVCRNLAELKRRDEIDAFTHVFISLEEYQEDEDYFNELASRTTVIMVVERSNEKYVDNPDIIRLYKPFYILPVVSILNGNREAVGGKQMTRPNKFTAPDAHVLVVDDNRMNIRVVEGLLKEYQIKVTYATSGHEALEIIENMNYDFVFMDHMMPEMDGIETFHRIRDKAGRYYQQVPIIALTANAAPGNREMFLEEGFNDFVEKPLEVSVLERVLKRNLPEEKIIYHTRSLEEELESDGNGAEWAADASKTIERIETIENIETIETAEPVGDTMADDDKLVIGDLDIEKGILYCGSKSAYLEILEECYIEGADERSNIEKLFEEKDWKNYTIRVHALKSTMKSIGANNLFEMAKALEEAGRNIDIDYILQNHEAVLAEHRRVMNEIAQAPVLSEVLSKSDNLPADVDSDNSEILDNTANSSDLPELEDSDFDDMLVKLEDAAYSLDGEQMLTLVSKLQEYQYNGTSLKDKLEPYKKKIEKTDYMSALDNISNICNELKNGKKGESVE
ncbi:MAG: response regulator [Lachnospiraceae bacterium]|nr:response regulator [Lachnospiraceae bacterium]